MVMSPMDPFSWKGLPLAGIDTPSLLVDAGALQANLDRMAEYFANRPCGLRPHFKSHKCTHIARLQMQAGAVGITCAKLGEAETLAEAGIRDLLIANQIVGEMKIARLVELARRSDPITAVDSAENVRALSKAAAAGKVEIRLLVEVDLGMKRCGVPPGAPALELARLITSLPGIKFAGLQGYEGHLVALRDKAERTEKTRAALKTVVETRRLLESAGIPVSIVTGGGTGTYNVTGDFAGYDEVQAGSYALMDWWYGDIRPEFQQAMSILATVISRPTPELAILDVGRKGIGAEFGPPRIKNLPGASVANFGSEEHTSIALPQGFEIGIGGHLELIPSHGCTTSNLYREIIAHRQGVVADIWPIEGSGRMR